MKKLLLTSLVLAAINNTAQANYNFEIWNKTKDPVYFELGTEKVLPKGENLQPINAFGKKQNLIKQLVKGSIAGSYINLQGDYAQAALDPKSKEKVVILLSRGDSITSHKPGALITIHAGKDIVVELKEDPTGLLLFTGDNRKYGIVPQAQKTLGYSERDLRLKFNVTAQDLAILTEDKNKSKKLVAEELKSRGSK